jgi:hypothetical protein
VYPLSAGFGFKNVATGTTVVSKVETPLPVFPMEAVSTEVVDRFLATVETNAEKILGSYGPREHEACMIAKLLNNGCLNWVFEQMGGPLCSASTLGYRSFHDGYKKAKSQCVEENRC